MDSVASNTNQSPMKICLVSPCPPPLGGIGRWTTLVHRWASNNPQVCITQVDISPRWRFIDDTAIWKRVVGGGLQLIRDYVRFIIAVRRADLIHLTTSGSLAVVRDLAIFLTASILKIPIVYHLHFGRVPEIASTNTLEWRMLVLVMRYAKTVISLDATTHHIINTHLPYIQATIIPNPIDFSCLPPPTSRHLGLKRLLFLGWIIPTKGVEDLLMAWNNLMVDGWELVFAGPVSRAYQYELIERYAPHNVSFVGEVQHDVALQMIADCDLFVLPSHTEAFPFVILEAMALGKAIVASKVGAIPEMLEEGCGVVVRSHDVDKLNEALKFLTVNATLREQLGGYARKRAESNYSFDKVFNKLWSIWCHAIDKKI